MTLSRLLVPLAQSRIFIGLVIGLAVFLGIEAARHARLLQPLELTVYDAYVRNWRHRPDERPPVAFVIVTENDIRELRTWPLSDEMLALLIERIASGGPRAIGLDIYRDTPVPPGTERFEQVLRSTPSLIAVYKFQAAGEVGVAAPPALAGSAQVGFNDVLPDAGGVVRRGLLFLSAERAQPDGTVAAVTGYSFPLQLALLHLAAEGIYPAPDPVHPELLRLGPTTVAPLETNDGGYVGLDARGYQFLLDYVDRIEDAPRVTVSDLLSGNVDTEVFANRVVLIGSMATSLPDILYTPLLHGPEARPQMPGVAWNGHVAAQLIRFGQGESRPVLFMSGAAESLWTLAWSLLAATATAWVGSMRRSLLVSVAAAAVLVLVTVAAFVGGWWIPIVPPALAWLVSVSLMAAYLANQEARQRRLLMMLFARHVDPKLAEAIWHQREKFLEGGRPSSHRLIATVLFSDLQGFTRISETLSAGDLMEWFNEYMRVMTPLVMQHQGVLLRFMGDAIMAVFGAPIPRESDEEIALDACNAVRCGLAMEQAAIAFNERRRHMGHAMIGIRIGIFTGPMVGGSIGDRQRLEYNVHGDSVNTAARLETFDKESFKPDYLTRPVRILIGETTLERLGDRFETVRVGEVTLRGKSKPVAVYRVLGERAARGDSLALPQAQRL